MRPEGSAQPSRLLLASRSPQRRAILEQLGIPFDVRPAEVAEETEGAPEAVARENALRKALAVAGGERSGRPVLGVDTLVALGDELFGKPAGEDAARATLSRLAGREHRVVSGLALVHEGEPACATAVTTVAFRELDEGWIDWYVGTGEWRERAGGYAIQARGAALVRGIEGDYLNVVGLPVATLVDLWPGIVHRDR